MNQVIVPVQSSYVTVKISILLPMSAAGFDDRKQQVFKDSIASVVGAPVSW